MPRPKRPVKTKRSRSLVLKTIGAVDLHFHGAYGIDLMTADRPALDLLALKLRKDGVAGFCATTLSAPRAELKAVVEKLGRWITESNYLKTYALPLGIHLEGPFIGAAACGAHPPGAIRPVDLEEIAELWQVSAQTLKIITVAPEAFKDDAQRKSLVQFCKERKIKLALGHTSCTEREAKAAFDAGLGGLTHAWNALGFHHRAPGALGAALGRPGLYVELILDLIHVSPTVIRWTLDLHRNSYLCFVSDAAPAARTSGALCSFGPLKIRFSEGACRLENGHLAGGALLLPEAYAKWLEGEATLSHENARNLAKQLKKTVRHLTTDPLKMLSVPISRLRGREVVWKVKDNRIRFD